MTQHNKRILAQHHTLAARAIGALFLCVHSSLYGRQWPHGSIFNEYMESLETASVEQDIGPFAKLLGGLVQASLEEAGRTG